MEETVVFGAGSIKRLYMGSELPLDRQNRTRSNAVIVVDANGNLHRGHTAHIDGPSTLHYQPQQPLPSGVVAWIETLAPVRLIRATGPMSAVMP